jgi:protein phosphatase
MKIRSDIILANASDTGCVRSGNEDYYLFIEPQDDAEFEQCGRLILVADGMGGYKGGRIASRLAADAIREVFSEDRKADPLAVLREGFGKAHRSIQECALTDPELQNMGTTCTAIILRHGRLSMGHVGDSRLYLIREEQATRISRDHTVVGNLVARGLITEEEASRHDEKHVLSAALGVGPQVDADFIDNPIELKPGDILLLCTDGLHGVLSDGEIVSATTGQSLSDACAELIAWAKVRGGPDNITLQLVGIGNIEDRSKE